MSDLIKTALFALAVIVAIGTIVIVGFGLRRSDPRTHIVVSAFDIFEGDQQPNRIDGKALADLLVDDLHDIIDRAQGYSGNRFSSRMNYMGPMPDSPRIPVDTTYGIEIKGVSVDQVVATWQHIRFKEFQVGGDLIISPRGKEIIRVRYSGEERANSFEEAIKPAFTG